MKQATITTAIPRRAPLPTRQGTATVHCTLMFKCLLLLLLLLNPSFSLSFSLFLLLNVTCSIVATRREEEGAEEEDTILLCK